MTTINTPEGQVTLLPPPPELLSQIAYFMPFGLVGINPPERGARFGLVMQCGQQELYAIKQQPPDSDEEQGRWLFQINTLLIARSLADYQAHGFSGLWLPCAYLRSKEDNRAEAGLAYFGYPSPEGREAQPATYEVTEEIYAAKFGRGFAVMMTNFMHAFGKSARDMGLTFTVLGLDIRRRLQLGNLGLSFMLVGPHIICLKTSVVEQDPIWTMLKQAGIQEVFHLPSLPVAINESQLHPAKQASLADLAQRFADYQSFTPSAG